ncbi:MAG: TetR/AcrR family transcriptional regulator [Parvibaculum sp.]|nr:TetR/AcrR family transcriptional regulator [Parvibaculum sp.]
MDKKVVKTQGKQGAAPARPRRKRLSPEERRVQIVAAARSLFVAEGTDNVSMRKIASRVGITQAAIYQHFENKEAIFFVIIEGFFADLLAALETASGEETEPLHRLRRAMRAYIEYGLSRPEEYRLVFMTPMSGLVRAGLAVPRTDEARHTPSKGSLAFDVLDRAVRDVVMAGRTRFADTDLLAEAIWAAGHGIVSLLITHDMFPWTDRERIVEFQLDLVFRGLLHDNCPMRQRPFEHR